MPKILLLVKKTPAQVGFGLLQTFMGTYAHETPEKATTRLMEDATKAAYRWKMNYPGWKFRVVNAADYGYGFHGVGTYVRDAYYDDVQQRLDSVNA